MTAVIETGGKQYCITPGQNVTVERLAVNAGETVRFTNLLNNDTLELQVVDHTLGDKVVSRKFRNKTRYHRVRGHRQSLTILAFGSGETKEKTETPKRRTKKEA